jgi:hypothetical protein
MRYDAGMPILQRVFPLKQVPHEIIYEIGIDDSVHCARWYDRNITVVLRIMCRCLQVSFSSCHKVFVDCRAITWGTGGRDVESMLTLPPAIPRSQFIIKCISRGHKCTV